MFKTLKRDDIKELIFKITICAIFLFGIYLRAKLYVLCDYFEDDECRLALAMRTKHLWQAFSPLGPLSCTPVFFFISKIIAELTKYNEYALKFLPFVFSIGNLFLFYRICKDYFKRKFSICLSMFLLSVNFCEIYYSSIFKTYSLEVFITLLCLYCFPKIDITKLNYKKLILLTAAITILPLISLPSLYFIGLFILVSLYKIYKSKSSYLPVFIILIPFFVVFLFYYLVNLAPTKHLQLIAYPQVWDKNLNPSIISVFACVYRFLNTPNMYPLYSVLLACSSIIYIFCNKKEYAQVNYYIVFTLLVSVFSAYIHLYSLTLGRTSLFLLPIVILLAVKLFDVLKVKSYLFLLATVLFILGHYLFFVPDYMKLTNDVISTYRNFAPKVLMIDLKNRFDEKKDIVISTESSAFSFLFYANKEGFSVDNLDFNSVNLRNNKPKVYDYLNNMNPEKNYYFYLIKDYKEEPMREYVQEWLKGQQIIYERKENDSYLYYIKGVKPYIPEG